MQLTYNAMTVLKERILLPGETPNQMLHRVASTVAKGDPNLEKQFFNIMDNLYFLPNSPCLMNAGTGIGQLSACFVLPVEDNMESIFGTLRDMAMVQKSGGGLGFSGSRLRPKGDMVNSTKGVASGPVSFFNVYDSATEEIKQGGKRRGACLLALPVHHPDIIEFIESKTHKGRLQNFNISVGVTDEFMDAVTNGKDYDLINPRTNKVVGRKNAREVFDLIAECAWLTGDPGVIFLDTINRFNPTPSLGEIETTNPCWTGDTKVWTLYGPKTFKELAESGQDIPVLSEDDNGKLSFKMMKEPRVTRRNAKLVEIVFDKGRKLRCTPNHNIYLKTGEVVQAKDLKEGDRISSCYRYRANQKGYLRLTNGKDMPLEHYVAVEWKRGRVPDYPNEHAHHIDGNKQNNAPENLEIMCAKKHNSMGMVGAENPMFGIWDERNPLYGIPVDGKNNPMYRHDISVNDVLSLLQRGYTRKQIERKLRCSRKVISNRIKQAEEANLSVANHRVVSVKTVDTTEDVYNGTVDSTHRYFVMTGDNCAILSANCGEVPLLPYESCVLGSINLSKMVAGDKVNMGLLKRVVWLAVEFLNNIVDINNYPLPEIKTMTQGNRKIGLGVMGWGDMLYKLEVPYNSDDALRLAEKVMGFINKEAQKASQEMALKSGSFPNYPQSTRTVPRANACVTSIAPTGTISVIADCSSGIEPIFGLVYYETALDGKQMKMVNPIFLDELRRKKLYSDKLLDDIQNNNGSIQDLPLPEDMRRVFVVAHDVTPERHVKMQAAFQKHVELSVSKTVNLPHSATTKDVANVFVLAYYSGCKGITVYRDRSRDDQVLSCQIGCETC